MVLETTGLPAPNSNVSSLGTSMALMPMTGTRTLTRCIENHVASQFGGVSKENLNGVVLNVGDIGLMGLNGVVVVMIGVVFLSLVAKVVVNKVHSLRAFSTITALAGKVAFG